MIHLHELLIPLVDVCSLATVVVLITSGGGVALVVITPLHYLLQDSLIDLAQMLCFEIKLNTVVEAHVGNGNSILDLTKIFKHVLNEDRFPSRSTV